MRKCCCVYICHSILTTILILTERRIKYKNKNYVISFMKHKRSMVKLNNSMQQLL